MTQLILELCPLSCSEDSHDPSLKTKIEASTMNSLTLGANPITGIPMDSGLSPAICMVNYVNEQLSVQGVSAIASYYINTKRVLGMQVHSIREGHVISLALANGKIYSSYRVRIGESSVTCDQAIKAHKLLPYTQTLVTNTTPTSSESSAKQTHPAAEECSCPFCLEIQVQSTTLVPCGHSFCKTCVESCQECPTCRASVKTTVLCRTVDNIIHAMVQSRFFEPDDVQMYEERRANSITDPSEKTRRPDVTFTRPRKRQRYHDQFRDDSPAEGASEATAICIDD